MIYHDQVPAGDPQEPEWFGVPEAWCDICGEALPYRGRAVPVRMPPTLTLLP